MHLKPYLIDLSICITAATAKIYASITGLTMLQGFHYIDKIIYCLVMLITGFTTLYRFIKEVRADRKNKKEN